MVARWLKRRSTGRGEWSMADLHRDYRICNYNDERHAGPHIHFPINGPIVDSIDISESQATDLMRRYATRHASFSASKLHEVLTTWKSGSKKL